MSGHLISWVTDITYIRSQEGWLYLAVVLDLFSRQIVGWAMKSRMTADLAVYALLMAVWRRKPKQPLLVHSDQGSQFTGGEWQDFLKTHNLSCHRPPALGDLFNRFDCECFWITLTGHNTSNSCLILRL